MDLILSFLLFFSGHVSFFCIQRRGRATTELAERPGERGRAIAPDAPVRLPFSLSLSLSQSHSPVKTQHSFLVSAAFVGAAAAAATAVVVVVAVVAVVVVVG